MTYRLRNIVIAVGLALLAVVLTSVYVTSYQRQVDNGQKMVDVYVAKDDIAPGTSASEALQNAETVKIARKNVVPAAVSTEKDIAGQVASQWIYADEQITARRFSPTGRSGVHTQLKSNMRAFEVNGNRQQLLVGTLKSGDHVDVVVNLKVSDTKNVSRILLRDILVLRTPGSSDGESKLASSSTAQGAFAVMLRLTDSQAHKLFFVTAGNENHEWWLDLRGPSDATDSPESLTTLESVLRDGLRNRTGGNR